MQQGFFARLYDLKPEVILLSNSHAVTTYLFSQRNVERKIGARKGAWEGG